MRLLVEAGADRQVTNKARCAPACTSAMVAGGEDTVARAWGRIDVWPQLTYTRSRFNYNAQFGDTPLHRAKKIGHTECVRMLTGGGGGA